MTQLEIVTECFVPGIPKTKGSMEHIGNGNMRESVTGSTKWKHLMAQAIRDDRQRRGCGELQELGPVGVRCVFWLPGNDTRWPAPIKIRSGDIDKMARNVLDALTEAGAYWDDVQVVKLLCSQFWAYERSPGALIQAWRVPAKMIRVDQQSAHFDRDRVQFELSAKLAAS